MKGAKFTKSRTKKVTSGWAEFIWTPVDDLVIDESSNELIEIVDDLIKGKRFKNWIKKGFVVFVNKFLVKFIEFIISSFKIEFVFEVDEEEDNLLNDWFLKKFKMNFKVELLLLLFEFNLLLFKFKFKILIENLIKFKISTSSSNSKLLNSSSLLLLKLIKLNNKFKFLIDNSLNSKIINFIKLFRLISVE